VMRISEGRAYAINHLGPRTASPTDRPRVRNLLRNRQIAPLAAPVLAASRECETAVFGRGGSLPVEAALQVGASEKALTAAKRRLR
jgi:hypothetical protein